MFLRSPNTPACCRQESFGAKQNTHSSSLSSLPSFPKIRYTCSGKKEDALGAYRLIGLIATMEILLGGITLLATGLSLVFSFNTKPPNVLFFVMTTALLSLYLGIGLLNFQKRAYQLLIYFASVIVLSKLLIFANIIHLNGALETSIPSPIKNSISILYHAGVIFYLMKNDVKKMFDR